MRLAAEELKAARSRWPGLERLEDRLTPVGDFGFAFGLGGPSNDQGLAIATDSAGNVFVAGGFAGSADFDPGAGVVTLSTAAGSAATTPDAFVAKYDPAGALLWARRMGGSASDNARALAVDDLGDVYVAGQFAGTSATFGGTTLSSAGINDVFVSRLDGAGNFLWTKRVGGTGDDAARGIAVDAARSPHLVGQFEGTVDFNPDPGATANLTSGGSTDVFVLKLDAVGGFTWARAFGSSGADLGFDLALDASGNVYTTGTYRSGTNDFDPGPGTTTLLFAGGNQDAFFSKLDSAGTFAWASGIGGPQSETGASIAADAAGNVYLAGSFGTTVDFNPDPVGTFFLTAAGSGPLSSDAFVAKYTTAGSFSWAGRLGGPAASDFANGIALDAAGDVYVVGTYTALADLDPDPADSYTLAGGLTPPTATVSTYVEKLDAAGDLIWVRGFDGGTAQIAAGIAVDGKGRVYTTGTFAGTVDFDPHPTAVANRASAGSFDAFVAQLTQLASIGAATTAADADGYALDTNNDGTFDAVNTTDNVILTRNAFTSLRRGLMEFDLSGIDPRSTIQAATLTVQVIQLEGLVGESINVAIDAYTGDGVLTTADATATATQVGQALNLDLGTLSIPLSTSFLQSLLGTGSQVGLRVRLLSGTGVGFASTESPFDAPPRLTLTLGPPATNFAPASNNDAYFLDEDTTLTVPLNAGVLDNDSDLNGNPLTATLVSGPSVGTLTFNPNGTFTYTPPPNFSDIVPFTYKANDGTADGNVATVFLLVNPVDDAPVAVDDLTYSTNEDTTLSIAAPGVLANDTDIDNAAGELTAEVVSPPSRGNLILQRDGSFVYFPPANFNGVVNFTYRVGDGQLFSAPALATITVNPVNDAPEFFIVGPLTLTVAEDAGAQSIANYTTGMVPGPSSATDESGQALNFLVTVTGTTGGLTFTQAPAISPTGTLTFTAAANSSGTATLSVVLADNGGTANGGVDRSGPRTVTIAVNAVNDPPVNSVPGPRTTDEDQAVPVVVQVTDPDAGSSPLSVSLSLPAGTGRLDVSPFPGATVTGNGTGTLQVVGTLGQINETLASLAFTPAADYNGAIAGGPVVLTVTTTDQGNTGSGGAKTDVDTVAITINPVNDRPDFKLPVNTVASSLEDAGPQTLPGWAFDIVAGPATATDEAGQALVFEVAVSASNGLTFSQAPAISPNGTLTYTTAPNSVGTATIIATLIDDGGTANGGADRSVVRSFNIVVSGVNDAPTLDPIADVNTFEDAPAQTVPLAGISPGPLQESNQTVTITATSSNPAVVPNPVVSYTNPSATGSLSFTPVANANGTAVITVTVTDNGGTANGGINQFVRTFTVTVNPVNDAPAAAGDSYATPEDTPLSVAAPGVLGNDSDVEGTALSAVLVSGPAHGTLALNADGSFTYTPAANYNGPDSFTYRASDGVLSSAAATVTIAVTAVNDPPVAADLSVSTAEDTPVAVTLAGTDVDGDSLTYAIVAGPARGTLSGTAPNLTYTPAPNDFGTVTFTYQVTDATAASNVATVTITINAVNDAPVAAADSYTVVESTPLTVPAPGVLGNDTDVDGPALSAVLVSGPAHGTLALNADGSFTYTPAAGYNGPDGFTYRASDGSLSSGVATVALTIAAVNDPPVARDDGYSTPEDNALTVAAPGVLGNDSDPEGQALTALLVAGPSNGTLALNADGSFTYTPGANFNGTDSFTYRASDGALSSAAATVTINVVAANDAPVAPGDSYAVDEDATLTVPAPGVLSNDSDVDGHALTALLVSGPSRGTLALNADGSFTYTPAANFNGPDSFTYRASDGSLSSAVATVTLTVRPVNDAPVAAGDVYSVAEDSTLTVAAPGVLGNDTDVEGPALSAVLVSGPAHGTLALNGNGSFTYTPAANYNGPDSFTYRASDGALSSAAAAVTINVTAVNDAPVASGGTFTTDEDTTLNGSVSGTDVDGNTLTYSVVANDLHGGSLTLDPATGAFSYSPAANYNGPASFTYKVNDGTVDSPTATVSITVRAVNDAPTLPGTTFSLPENSPSGTTVGTVTGSDVDGDALTYSITAGNTGGAFAININTGAITVANPAALNFERTPVFDLTVQVRDPVGLVGTAIVRVSLADVPEAAAPVIDINPGDTRSRINPASHGKIEVAILSTADFDARRVDVGSLRFGRTGTENSISLHPNKGPRFRYEDVNGDGLLDLVVQFETDLTGFQAGDTKGILTGHLLDGTAFTAEDDVSVR